ncbi:hypothetical protein ACFVAJ_10210 [Agromyces sp. NPDC057679]|uniref:hypothetical protein n=1 Tax=Agromyces sp. NPDC057679 TaxID=3346207 RepID=UPI00367107F6
MPGSPVPAAEPESRAARRSAEAGGTLRPRRMPDRASAWAPPPVAPGGAASPAAATPAPMPVPPAPVAPAVAAEVERYYLCCEVPSGDFVEVILAVSDGGRRRYFTTSDGDRLAEVDEYYFVRRSLGDARSMLELDAREMAELEAELNFVRPLRGRDPLAELAAEAAGAALEIEAPATDATEPATPEASVEPAVVHETPVAAVEAVSVAEPTAAAAPAAAVESTAVAGPSSEVEPAPTAAAQDAQPPSAAAAVVEPSAAVEPAVAEPTSPTEVPPVAAPAPLEAASEATAAPETDAEAWVELLRRAGFEPPELNLDQLDSEPVADAASSPHPESLMVEPVLMQWAETIDRQPEGGSESAEAHSEPSPAVEPEPSPTSVSEPGPTAAPDAGPAPVTGSEPAPAAAAEALSQPGADRETLPEPVPSAPLTPPKLTLVPEPPVVTPLAPTPRLTLVPGPPPEPTTPTPAPTFPSGAEVIPEAVPAAHAAPASDPDSNEETNPVAMMTNQTDALAPAASVTPIAAPAALHSAPAPVVDADAAAQIALAKGIAFVAHRGQVDQVGADYIDHPGRVAEHFDAATEPVATAAAWLHDVVERSAVSEQELLEAGVRPDIVEIVVLLTRTPEMSDDEYFARIRSNPLARRVKLADVADNSSPWRVRKLDYDAQQRLAAKYRHAREALG